MDLEQYEGEVEREEEEDLEEGGAAMSTHPPRDDAKAVFSKHKGKNFHGFRF